jgi:hypothetical protein
VDSGLNDIAALSANNVWVVGHAGNGTIGDALIEHWDGSAWNVVPAPNPGAGRILEGVSALAANDIWAVGHIGYGFPTISVRTLTMHWDGATWTEVPSPNFKPDGSMLLNVAAVSPGDVWAVGTTGRYQHISTLAEHYTADNFTDVHPADYFYDAVNYLACHGMVSGYADTTFHPYAGATRAQLCKIITLAEGWTVDCPPSGHFSDVQPGSPFYCFVETAYTHGIISGYADGTFRPGSNVTRSQLCKIIVLAEEWAPYTPPAPTFQDVSANSPFYGYIETAYNHAIISGYGCGPGCLVFRPGNHAIRGQICKIVYLAITSP